MQTKLLKANLKILFIRKKPDGTLLTAEIDRDGIKQIRGYGNQNKVSAD